MAGRKHHHVPQLLQRRFGLQGAKSTKIVVFSRSKEPFVTNTANYGAERDFYSNGSDFFVDELITDFEGDIQSFVMRLVEGDASALDDKETVAALIAHLEMRSMFLRNQLLEISGMMGDLFERIFCNRENLVKALHNQIKEDPTILRDGLVKLLGRDAPIAVLEELILPQMKPIITQQSAILVEAFAEMLINMRAALRSAVKPAQLRALNRHPSDVARSSFYSSFNFRIQRAPLGSFILPDTMVAFCSKKRVTPFAQKGDDLVELFLPLASGVMLVGAAKSGRVRQISELNSMLASTSFGSFIGLEDKAEFRNLVKKIGRNARIFSPSDSQRLFRDILRGVTANLGKS